jgi:leucyl aminopeptidase
MSNSMADEVSLQSGRLERADAELLAIGVRQGNLDRTPIKNLDSALKGEVGREIARRGFDGRSGAQILLPTYGAIAARNVLLFGLGTEPNAQTFRLLGEAAVRSARTVRARSIVVGTPDTEAQQISAIAEGVDLSDYRFKRYKGAPDSAEISLRISIVGQRGSGDESQALQRGRRFAAATNFARDLINTPADDATPEFLAEAARALAAENGLECDIHDRGAIEKLKMGA